jgi:hypothetical protein
MTAIEDRTLAVGQAWQSGHDSTIVVIIDVPAGDGAVSYLYCTDGVVQNAGACPPDVFTGEHSRWRRLDGEEQPVWLPTAVTSGSIIRREQAAAQATEARLTEVGERLATAQREHAAELAETQRAHDARIERITARLHQEANSRSYCSEFDEIMEEMGLEARERDFGITVYLQVSRTLTVSASSEDAAYEAAPELARSDMNASSGYITIAGDEWRVQTVTTEDE